ncbi:MAG: prephenate dehydrogenase [Firmicutes bacterium]|nr:prephenate dehydrogenase [Bacillota bacterium]MBR0105322.1 prephenate dehydrogenase [Bacillota bacterium]
MIVGISGIGLIGGSMAKAYKQAGHTVLVYDRDKSIAAYAQLSGVSDGELTQENLPDCDLVLIALYPTDAINYMEENAPYFSKNAVVMDLCGTKRLVCQRGFELAKEHGFTYVGGHPMAGTQFSGFKYSSADLFRDQPMVIVPPAFDDIYLLQRVKDLLEPAGFSHMSVTNSAEHDKIIAFTSQMAHVVSNAFIKSPTARLHKGFSAGSYKDLTRVAWLNEDMWSDLFLENKDYLVDELDFLLTSLQQYKDALESGDRDRLKALLLEGSILKEEVDGNND